ncbi:MAG: hypothetical protein H7Y18_18675 [Clostridiaceae bacterium]|nr:hypothetical protein [Clostridiaceae bacterium]
MRRFLQMNDKRAGNKEETENKIESLINVVEKRERTERHLEEYSDEKGDEKLKSARRLQNIRDEEISNLKNNILGDESRNEKEVDNLKRNYEFSEGYLNNNEDHMKSQDIKNLKEKQEHRKEELDRLDTF